jgi:hypothetical protein
MKDVQGKPHVIAITMAVPKAAKAPPWFCKQRPPSKKADSGDEAPEPE